MMFASCAVERDLADHQRRVDEDIARIEGAEHARQMRAMEILWDINNGNDAERLKALWDEYMEFHSEQIVDAFWSLGPADSLDVQDKIDAVFAAFAGWAAGQKEAA